VASGVSHAHADRYGQNAIGPMLRRTPHRVDRDDRTLVCHLLADGMEIAQHRDPRLRAWRLTDELADEATAINSTTSSSKLSWRKRRPMSTKWLHRGN
jgi:hypothetical protein